MGQFQRWVGKGSGVPADIAGLITAWGVTPLVALDARYGTSGSGWNDARGASHGYPIAWAGGNVPTFSGSGPTALVTFNPSTTVESAVSIPVPATGFSILMLAGMSGGTGFGGPGVQGTSPGYYLASLYNTGVNIALATYVSATHSLSSTVAKSSNVRSIAMSYAWTTGAAAIQVDAVAQQTATQDAGLAPTGNLQLTLAVNQSSAAVMAAFLLPGLYTSGMYSTFTTWATANHTYV